MITPEERQQQLIDDYGKYINPSKAKIMSEAGLGIVESRREGPYLWDLAGKRYIDCREDAGTYTIGRHNRQVAEALKKALDEMDLGNNLFFSEQRVHLAKKLGEISPQGSLTGVTFGVSGGEAVDFALKLACYVTGKSKVIAMENGYHGCTGLAVRATSNSMFRKPFKSMVPEFKHVPFGQLESLRSAIDRHTACVILEPIQGEGGVNVPKPGYLQSVREICDNAECIMLVDEIETGLGRTGRMFGVDYENVVPDIMTVGKALSGGLFPITATLYRPQYLQYWDDYPFSHLSTFGGSDLGCVAALETIRFIETNQILGKITDISRRFELGFEDIAQRHSEQIAEHRQRGLMIALEFNNKNMGPLMSAELAKRGVAASYLPQDPRIMRLLPPAVVSDEDIEQILNAFDESLSELKRPLRRMQDIFELRPH